jgi:DNA-directed RNA polymerase specialized sigma24 family protein
MSTDVPFVDLMRRVRLGDEDACAELVRLYAPAIRIAIHVRLNHSGLRRLLDSTDICQSVLANFFVRAASGQFELANPGQLVKLLATMGRNRLTNHALQQRAACRDHRRTEKGPLLGSAAVDPGPSPSQIVASNELLQVFQSRLSADERRLAEQRAAGKGWAEIATESGASVDSLRMRLGRALDRVARSLRLAE